MRSANNWLAFSLSPHLAIDAPDHASTAQSNGPKVARHTSADNGMAYNGSSSSEFYNTAESEEDGLPIRSDGSLCIMEAMSRSHSGDWPPQLNKTGHVQRSQHFLNAELSRFQGVGTRAASEQLQMSQTQYDSMNKTDPETVPKLEDFLGGATSLGGQYSTRSDSQTHNYDNLYMRDINVNLSPYSSAAQQQQQQAGHVSPSFHPYGIQRTDASSQQPYDTHSSTTAAPAEGNLCNTNVQQHARQNLLQVALDQQQQQQQHRHSGSGAPGGDLFIDCARQLPQGPNLSALKSWLQHNQAAAAPGSVNALGGAGAGAGAAGDNQPVGVGKSGIPTLANFQHSLSLSMSPGSQSSNTLQAGSQHAVQAEASSETRKRVGGRAGSKEASPRKSIDNFGQRTSVYRGVTRHRWTGRYEAHLWDNSCRKEGQTRKGRQVYLGGYDKEEKAARAYDLAALKYWGANTTINFPLPHYEKEVEEMKNMSRQEYVASLRRKSSGFSRGASVYRGVTRHHQHGRWQARIGRVAGNKDLYLGTYSTQEEAAEAYDIAAIKFRGINAVTNFDISRYDTNRICGTGHNPGVGETTGNEASAAGIGNNVGAKALPSMGVTGTSTSAQGGSGFGQVSAKELHLVVMPDQQRSEVSVDQTEDESQSLQTGNAASQGRDGGLMVSRPTSHLQDWQMLYQQQSHRSWDDPSSHGQQQSQLQQQHHQHHPQQQPQTHHHQSQDVRTQALMSMTDTKFMPTSNMHSTVLRNLIGLNEGGGSHSASETSGGLMGLPVSGHGSNNMLGTGHGGYGGAQQSPKGNSQLSLRESEDESSKTSGGGSAYENVLQGDFSRHIMYMSQKQSPPQGSQSSSVTNAGYDSSSIGGSSWMSPPASLSGRVNLGPGHMPIFAAWNE